MTRLSSSDVECIERELPAYEAELVRKTGLTLRQIAASAAGLTERELIGAAASYSAAVIPVTAGEGIIEHFASSVCSILTYLGCPAFVTDETDVSGIAEGVTAGAGLLFMADDRRFVAVHLRSGVVIDNGEATGRGYAAALGGMAGDLRGQPVLVLGAGPVGCGAVALLRKIGARPFLFDIDADKACKVGATTGAILEENLREALAGHRFIVDATPTPAFIDLKDLRPDVLVAAPGIPLGLTDAARTALEARVIHDPLQIGVATMLAMAVGARQPG